MASTSGAEMSEDVPWGELPPGVIECVLSFLSVPVLCRLRTVCKGWNELLCSSRFHDVHEKSNREHHREVCFVRRFKVCHGYTAVDIPVQNTTCFLDFDERRWYTIEGAQTGYDTRAVAMDDALVAEFWCEDEEETMMTGNYVPAVFGVEMIDPISKLSFTLRSPILECPPDDDLPMFVLDADHKARSFRIFLIDNSGHVAFGLKRFLRIFESSACTNSEPHKWRSASYPPNLKWEGASNPPRITETNSITRARSAVCFRGDLYAVLSPFSCDACFLMKYDCQSDTWSMVLQDLPNQPAYLRRQPAHPQLLVCGNRLYMWFWRPFSDPTSRASAKHSAALEMVEIQIPENVSKAVLEISSARLEQFFGEPIDNLASVFPRVSSDGSCSSVVLVAASTGTVVVYNVVSGSADMLPEHPLGDAEVRQRNLRQQPRMRHWATLKNLCLREIVPKRWRRHPPFPFTLRDHTNPLHNVDTPYILDFKEEELDDYEDYSEDGSG